MRLLNTTSFTFKEFWTTETPPYGILSHCWSQDADNPEISYRQFLTGSYRYGSTGWQKIKKCCVIALSHGLDWAWIDTCCINKESSTELTEAINSMYAWYRNATKCYVLLDDVVGPRVHSNGETKYEDIPATFRISRWFERGWTLQELLAPSDVLFYDRDGVYISSRFALCSIISVVTGIEQEYLLAQKKLSEASIAQRMSWAAKRQTTRVEDRAYSLLGLFDVNLPLLYGEGTKAFQRLQLAVIQQSNDRSIFAWGINRKGTSPFGILAQDPSDFAGSERVMSAPAAIASVGEPTQVTNEGIAYSYKTSVGDVLRPIWQTFCVESRLRESTIIRIQLPCVIMQQSRSLVGIVLLVQPTTGVHRASFTRRLVKTEPIGTFTHLLYLMPLYESKVYIKYNPSDQQTVREDMLPRRTTVVYTITGSISSVVRGVLSFIFLFGCLFGKLSWPREWNTILTFGTLICARDLVKSWPYLVVFEDMMILFNGTLVALIVAEGSEK